MTITEVTGENDLPGLDNSSEDLEDIGHMVEVLQARAKEIRDDQKRANPGKENPPRSGRPAEDCTDDIQPSVGEVRSGPVPGHFCRTGDRTVWSLTKFLGPGPGTATNHLYRSGPGPDRVQTVPALFIYLFIQD